MERKTVLIIFTQILPNKRKAWWKKFDTVIAPSIVQQEIRDVGCEWVSLESLIAPGSIYEASTLIEEISLLKLPNGKRLSKSYVYEGFELWWIHYATLFHHFCLPYTQYKKLLECTQDFRDVYLYEPPYKNLFQCYFTAHDRSVYTITHRTFRAPTLLPFGILIQIILTGVFLPILMIKRKSILLFTSDKFDGKDDWDFRLKFIYKELRDRKIPFVEFVRSLESWRDVLAHAVCRKRPVIYSTAITFIARYCSIMLRENLKADRILGGDIRTLVHDTEARFKLLMGIQYLETVGEDIWQIRLMKLIERMIGVKVGIFSGVNERSFHTLLASKLNKIPTVGILHGAASRHYNIYDFMQTYDGEKGISVDTYGLWSEWWREYYVKHSKVYAPEQLVVSGPIRPLQKQTDNLSYPEIGNTHTTKVLFVSEIVAVPEEVMPYLDALIAADGLALYIKFRSSGDIFESWLKIHRPDIFEKIDTEHIFRGAMNEAIAYCDVVVGSQSMGVIEATMQNKPFVFFQTKKWGDYFDVRELQSDEQRLFAENPQEFIMYVKKAPHTSQELLQKIKENFFGDPYQNGSTWTVDQAVSYLDS